MYVLCQRQEIWHKFIWAISSLLDLLYAKNESWDDSSRNQEWLSVKGKDAIRLTQDGKVSRQQIVFFISGNNPGQLAWIIMYGVFKIYRLRAWKKLREIVPLKRDEKTRSLLMEIYSGAKDRKVSEWALGEMQKYPDMEPLSSGSDGLM